MNMTKKCALFRETKYGFIAIFHIEIDADESWGLDDYVRISGWQVVEFKALPLAELAVVEMEALSALRAKTVDEFTEKLSYIDGRIANLRALTGPVAS